MAKRFSELELINLRAIIETAMNAHADFYRAHPSFVAVWVHGRLSPAVLAALRSRNEEMARWFRDMTEQFELVKPDAPEVGAWFAIEVADPTRDGLSNATGRRRDGL